MQAPAPRDHLTALITRAEERLNCSNQLAQLIEETLIAARGASARSRDLLNQHRK
jgi:hypothetical protein